MTPPPATVKFSFAWVQAHSWLSPLLSSPLLSSVCHHRAGGGGRQAEAAPGSPSRLRPLLPTLPLQWVQSQLPLVGIRKCWGWLVSTQLQCFTFPDFFHVPSSNLQPSRVTSARPMFGCTFAVAHTHTHAHTPHAQFADEALYSWIMQGLITALHRLHPLAPSLEWSLAEREGTERAKHKARGKRQMHECEH